MFTLHILQIVGIFYRLIESFLKNKVLQNRLHIVNNLIKTNSAELDTQIIFLS